MVMDLKHACVVWKGEISYQTRLLFPLSFIGQLVHLVGGDGVSGGYGWDCSFHLSTWKSGVKSKK